MAKQTQSSQDNSMEWKRELGKKLLKSPDANERKEGMQYVLEAFCQGDAEAGYMVGNLMLQGVITPREGDPTEHALMVLTQAANHGSVQARSQLNSICLKRYRETIDTKKTHEPGPLVDFEGKPIKINKTGIMTPVDATLEYKNGMNYLILEANVVFVFGDDIPNPEAFQRAVLAGMKLWQGEYKVFGNQPLKVEVRLTLDDRLWDNVFVYPMTDLMNENLMKIVNNIGSEEKKQSMESVISSKRSFAVGGFRKWSTRSRKFIYIMSEDGKFDDYEEIKHVAKHEFGHVLGLGDLYESSSDRLEGVEKGKYVDLDSFCLTDKFYNLVMCDHHGPISNNDIEMVLLAFWKNKAQLYQSGLKFGEISKALGKGN